MKRNLEIKAYARDLSKKRQIIRDLSAIHEEDQIQEDIFFFVPKGKLKLRILGKNLGKLIYYEKHGSSEYQNTQYILVLTEEPETLKALLQSVLKHQGIVRKKRIIYKMGDTRIHFDQVEGLGDFIEIECPVRPSQVENEAEIIMKDLMNRLKISKKDMLDKSYIDLILDKTRS
jgi:predicted adenylyl cyclase CyaB